MPACGHTETLMLVDKESLAMLIALYTGDECSHHYSLPLDQLLNLANIHSDHLLPARWRCHAYL